MRKTIEEDFRQARCEAEKNVRCGEMNTIVYMSGSKIKKTKMEKMLNRYREDSKTDYELGVIAKEIFDFEQKGAEILKKSIEHFVIY